MRQLAEPPSNDNAAENLRLALPQMSSRRIPVTPENYAVWYAFVCGEHPELNAEIERLDRVGATYTTEQNHELYSHFIAECDIAQFTQVRKETNEILREIGVALNAAGSEARSYSGTLESAVGRVEKSSRMEDIQGLLVTLIAETRSMQATNSRMLDQFETKTREIDLLQEELQRERKRATTDPLTGLANRVALFDAINLRISEATETEAPSMLMLDIDHFKQINDGFGHLIGDRVIRFVAQVMEENVKGRDVAARYGGEEFCILLPQTSIPGAQTVAETIRRTIADSKLVRSETKEPLGKITLSAGVARYRPGEDIMDFINRADQALYTSKHAGRNRVTLEDAILGVKLESA